MQADPKAAAPAAAAPAAAAKPAAAVPGVGKSVGCLPGEELMADGNCGFTAHNLNARQNLGQRQNLAQFNANIAPEKIHTLIPEAYRTLANDGSYDFNLGTQRTTFFSQQEQKEAAKTDPNQYNNWWYTYHHEAPEKVESFNWPIAARHTSFYADHKNATSLAQQQSQFDANSAPEKVQTLIPEAYRTTAHTIVPNPEVRTAFYAQKNKDETNVQFDANIEPEKIHTLIPEAYRSLANDGSYVFNLGEQRSSFFAQTGSDVQYDKKNKLWRTRSLIQTGKEDSLGTDNRDPWV